MYIVKTEVLGIAKEMFTNHQASLRQRTGKLLEIQVLLFRKSNFLAELYFDQSDKKFIKNLKKRIDSDEPTRNRGLVHMLKKNGLTVHTINNFKTLSKCPKCEENLEQLKVITILAFTENFVSQQ